MDEGTSQPSAQKAERHEDVRGYQPPTIEVIALDCEISSYAPDEDGTPLF